MNKVFTFIFLLLTITFTSCKFNNQTEKELIEFRSLNKTEPNKLKKLSNENIRSEFSKKGIEYGIITLQNSEEIKYWFKSHHLCKDKIGGTLFEMPNGKIEFIKGYFCCEVQFSNKVKFENSEIFMKEMRKMDGVEP